MKDEYIPQRLLKLRREIAAQHQSQKEYQDINFDSESELFIRELVKVDEKYLKVKAYSLDELEKRRLAAYIPVNNYKVDMYNIFEIYQYISTKDLAEVLYRNWQNSYKNLDCNNFMQVLCLQDEAFVQMLEEKHLSKEIFRNILNENAVVEGLIQIIKGYESQKNISFEEKLNYFGVKEESVLFRECKILYFTECEEKEYLDIPKEELVDLVKKYEKGNSDFLKKFLKNFLEKLSLANLIKFDNLAYYFQNTIDVDSNKNKHEQIFRDIPENLIKKYQDWINIYRLDKYFGTDERSLFWREYRMNKVTKNEISKSIVMEFDDYIIVEFLGQGKGPMYMYDKKYYNDKLKYRVMYGKHHEITQLLYQDTDNALIREEHRGAYGTKNGWDKKFHGIISEYHVTEHIVF